MADLRALATGTLIHSGGDKVIQEIRDSTDEYDKKVKVALDEAWRSPNHKASDMAVWEKSEGLVLRNGIVVVPRNRELRRKIIGMGHDGPIPGHPGRLKTREFVQRFAIHNPGKS